MRARTYVCVMAILSVLIAASCTDQTPTAPDNVRLSFAKTAGSGPSVKSTDPSRGEPGVTMSVRVLGTGYNSGSKVSFGIAGVPSAKITTNSTTFVSSTELVANITIAPDADLDSYDVIVITSEGKKGIGTELFLVAYAVTDLGAVNGFAGSDAKDVNQDGLIVGFSGYSTSPNPAHATMWRYLSPTQIERTDLHGLLQPAIRTIAFGVNLAGNIVGFRQPDSSTTSTRPFVLNSAGVRTDLHSACGATEMSLQSQAYDISDNNDIVGTQIQNGGPTAVYWAPNAVCAAVLPVPSGTKYSEAVHISANGAFVVGVITDANNLGHPVRWSRRTDGAGWDVMILGGVDHGVPTSVTDDGGATGYDQPGTWVRKRGSTYYDLSANGYFWDAAGTVTKMPSMGGDQLYAQGYGPLGIVGAGNLIADAPSHAFVDAGDGPADLGVLVNGGNSWATATAGFFIVGHGDVNTPGRGVESHAMVWIAR